MKEQNKIPLVRFLAMSGVGSRRDCFVILQAGKVSVNGKQEMDNVDVDPDQDRILVEGVEVQNVPELLYILLHKPKGYLVSDSDPEGRPLAKDLLPDLKMRLFPVGRLDFQSEGALLFTNDGLWANKIAHPRNRVLKTYMAKVRNIPTPATLKRWREGIFSDGQKLKAIHVRITKRTAKNAWLKITLSGGVNRQVRRMGSATGHPVVKLIRTAIGPIKLGELRPGAHRYLTSREIKQLKSLSNEPSARKNR